MSAPISIREVAALAGVSVGTVSNVLNRPTWSRGGPDRMGAAIEALGRPERVRAPAAHRAQPDDRAGRAGRGQPLLHRRRARRRARREQRGCPSSVQQRQHLPPERHYLELLQEHRVHGVLITPVGPGPGPADERGTTVPGRGRSTTRGAAWSARWSSTTWPGRDWPVAPARAGTRANRVRRRWARARQVADRLAEVGRPWRRQAAPRAT